MNLTTLNREDEDTSSHRPKTIGRSMAYADKRRGFYRCLPQAA